MLRYKLRSRRNDESMNELYQLHEEEEKKKKETLVLSDLRNNLFVNSIVSGTKTIVNTGKI